MIRKPAVAGQFYPSNPKVLKREVMSYFDSGLDRKRAKGIVSPHAGYIYSGRVCGEVFSRVEIPDHVIVLGPNHRGMGASASIMADGVWDMPLGVVEIDKDLSERILKQSSIISDDPQAHNFEHSLEVQLPFMQVIKEDFLLTPIALGSLSISECLILGEEIASAIGDLGEDVLIVASSDMTHYEPVEYAKAQDQEAIDEILRLDPEGVYDTVRKRGITMCGYIPVAVMLKAAVELGAKEAELIDYMTSGDTSGDYRSVVGYAGLIVY